jgi:hypothetical protein
LVLSSWPAIRIFDRKELVLLHLIHRWVIRRSIWPIKALHLELFMLYQFIGANIIYALLVDDILANLLKGLADLPINLKKWKSN